MLRRGKQWTGVWRGSEAAAEQGLCAAEQGEQAELGFVRRQQDGMAAQGCGAGG